MCGTYRAFLEALVRAFQAQALGPEAARAPINLRQGFYHVLDYSSEFRTLVVETGWAQDMLCTTFVNGLFECLQDTLVPLNLLERLHDVIAIATWLDRWVVQRETARQEGGPLQGDTPTSQGRTRTPGIGEPAPGSREDPVPMLTPPPTEEPMQLG